MPECQRGCDNGDFVSRRLLCATKNPVTNETISLPDLKEASAYNVGESSQEFMKL